MPSSCHEPQWTSNDMPDLTGYICIVTGGNSGIGAETVKQLALRNARVYIGGRSQEKVSQAIYQMNESAGRKLDLHFLKMDLNDLKSVKAAARIFQQMEKRLDILVNNAGIMATPFELTGDGYESQWQVDYLAPFVLTTSLLPLLLASAADIQTRERVRVVNLSSDMTMMGPRTMQLQDVNLTDTKGFMPVLQRYSHAKQGSIRHAKELNDRYSSQGMKCVTAYSLHPGVIKTGLQKWDQHGAFAAGLQSFMMKLTPTMSIEQGALTTLYCATSPEAPTKGQGRYFKPIAKMENSNEKWLNDRDGNRELWEHSEAAMRKIE